MNKSQRNMIYALEILTTFIDNSQNILIKEILTSQRQAEINYTLQLYL